MKACLLLVLGFALSMTSCGGSANLSRGEALRLVEAHEQKIGALNRYNVSGHLPSAIYTDVLTASNSAPGTTEEQRNALMGIQRANVAFYEMMVGKGWLKQETTCPLHPELTYRTYLCFQATTKDFYSGGSSTSSDRGNLVYDTTLGITFATVSQEQVTGIAQEGSQAQVDMEYDLTPTDIYMPYLELEQEMDANQKDPDFLMTPALWRGNPVNPAAVTAKQQGHYILQKYDDGWRVQ